MKVPVPACGHGEYMGTPPHCQGTNMIVRQLAMCWGMAYIADLSLTNARFVNVIPILTSLLSV